MNNKKSILKKISMSLDTMRPYLIQDGGDIEIVDLSDDYVLHLKFIGNCSYCSQTSLTSASIEEALRNYIPELKEIIYD